MTRQRAPRPAGSGAAVLVVALSACFSTVLPALIAVLSRGIAASVFGTALALQIITILSFGFLTITIVVSTTVITNASALITAGRVREIAVRRLLGASARGERRSITAAGTKTALIGIAIGAPAGVLLGGIFIAASAGRNELTADASIVDAINPVVVVPLVALLICARLAAWRGSIGVLTIAPSQALGAANVQAAGGESARIGVPAVILLGIGGLLLSAAVAASLVSPLAILIGLAGGVLSVIGFILGAPGIFPPVLRLVNMLFPRSAAGLLAARNLSSHPRRSARAALGVTLSVALVTMFVVGTQSFMTALYGHYEGTQLEGESVTVLGAIMSVVIVLIAATVVISSIGLANNITLSTLLRRKDVALVRVLGQGSRAAARTVIAESARLSIAATLIGLVLGAVYGWVGIQCVLGMTVESHVVVPTAPLALVPAVLLAAIALTVGASVVPSRRLLADSPIRALESV